MEHGNNVRSFLHFNNKSSSTTPSTPLHVKNDIQNSKPIIQNATIIKRSSNEKLIPINDSNFDNENNQIQKKTAFHKLTYENLQYDALTEKHQHDPETQ